MTEEDTYRRLNHIYPSAQNRETETQYKHICVSTFSFFIIGGVLVTAGEYIKTRVETEFRGKSKNLYLVSVLIISVGVIFMCMCVIRILYHFVIKEAGNDFQPAYDRDTSSSSPPSPVEFKCQIESETNSMMAQEDRNCFILTLPPKYDQGSFDVQQHIDAFSNRFDENHDGENISIMSDSPPCYTEVFSSVT